MMKKLIEIIRFDVDKLQEFVLNEIANSNITIESNENYLFAIKDDGLPILVAHMDHVYDDEILEYSEILYNEFFIWSPKGTRGDDRAGVFAVLELFKTQPVNLLLTNHEECGGLGAMEFVEYVEDKKLVIPYLIEIDRRGEREVVFYNGEEKEVPDFVKIFLKYFKKEAGVFSDISIIGGYLGIASANVSAGFYYNHQESKEYIHIPSLFYTMSVIPCIVKELGNKQFKIKPKERGWNYGYWWDGDEDYYFTGSRWSKWWEEVEEEEERGNSYCFSGLCKGQTSIKGVGSKASNVKRGSIEGINKANQSESRKSGISIIKGKEKKN